MDAFLVLFLIPKFDTIGFESTIWKSHTSTHFYGFVAEICGLMGLIE